MTNDARDRLLVRMETLLIEKALPWLHDLQVQANKNTRDLAVRSGADSARSSAWASSKWFLGLLAGVFATCGGVISAVIGALFG